jgi:DNA-binding NtrC family response regulator
MADLLVVDDDRDLAAALTDVLVDAGHTVRVAENGWAGVAALNERLPDLVLLDIEMPSLDGPGMANQMFVRDAGRERIPILLVSAFADLPGVARRIGTPYSAPKPCELGKLLDLVDRALRERIPPTFPSALGASPSAVGTP